MEKTRKSSRKRQWGKWLLGPTAALVLGMNFIAYQQAHSFTHFVRGLKSVAEPVSVTDKLKFVFEGIDLPRPDNGPAAPSRPYDTLRINGDKDLECWLVRADSARGTIALFHGYRGCKASMLPKAEELLRLGYSTLLVDFRGSGGSEGDATSIGYHEADDVKLCYDHLVASGEKNIYLLGTSMGAAAVMKALHDHPDLRPSAIVLECPFGTMYETTAVRFKERGVPVVPMVALTVFWGGAQSNFWAFSHNPADYASKIDCPSLLVYGERDVKVGRAETDTIFNHLKGEKELCLFPNAGHDNYFIEYKDEWVERVGRFLEAH
jgi:pimeloyl-ACP methyl ester carboxylesterase